MSLLSGVDVGHDDACAAKVKRPADVRGVRVPDPRQRRRSSALNRRGQRRQVAFGGAAMLEVNNDIVQAGGGPEARRSPSTRFCMDSDLSRDVQTSDHMAARHGPSNLLTEPLPSRCPAAS